jgi:hypothetical protein
MLCKTSTIILGLLILFVEKGIHDLAKMVKQIEKIGFLNTTETFCAKNARTSKQYLPNIPLHYLEKIRKNGIFLEHVMASL